MTFLMPGIRKFQRLGAEGFRNVCFEESGLWMALKTRGRILKIDAVSKRKAAEFLKGSGNTGSGRFWR